MSIIFVQVNECELVNTFFNTIHKRLQSNDLSKNMFRGKVKKIRPGCFVISMRSILLFNLPKWALKLFIKKGLRKAGYNNDIVFLSDKKGIERLLYWDK